MTEADWLVATEPRRMLDALQGRLSSRKWRLFAVACCRTVGPALGPEGEQLLEASEAFADGRLTSRQLAEYREAAKNFTAGRGRDIARDRGAHSALRAAMAAAWNKAGSSEEVLTYCVEARRHTGWRQALLEFANLLRDIAGNPFRSTTFDSRWRTTDTVGLARAAYEGWTFDRMPVLGDALMDAGCDADDILSHCRAEGPHVRGCWVVDFVLGKE